jgi:signal transduction histidine kinase
MNRLYLLLTLALLAVYGAIAIIVEVLVLPKQVYRPIETILAADDAAREGRRDREIIPETDITSDEIGQIMRSRNETVGSLRQKETDLAGALRSLEEVAGELKRKNHLLETARRNLADADRLASLGMMSAGIAHELNTPLAVLKGSVEEIAAHQGAPVPPERASLMLRVVRRLERLSESLLDFARVRPPSRDRINLREIVEEAWTLVSLDRDASRIEVVIDVSNDSAVLGDGDRLTQVLVNLLRNAVDALDGQGTVRVDSSDSLRDGRAWVSLTIADSGPGIDPAILPSLFEPFASTRMDSHGTGLGLAVAEGIVREHGGLILARNAPNAGAVFEIMLPTEGLSSPECRDNGARNAPSASDKLPAR